MSAMPHHFRPTRRGLAPTVIAAVLLWPTIAATQKARAQDTSPQALFARIDTNSDGKVLKEEVTRLPGVATRWEELDRNKDGWLSREEFVAGFRT